MSFEMLFVGSAPAQKVPDQGGQARERTAGTDGAFQALMSLALTAFFGGGPGNEVSLANGQVVEGGASEQVALTGGDGHVLWPPQGGKVWATTDDAVEGGGHPLKSGVPMKAADPVKAECSTKAGDPPKAGLVEVAAQAIETGGYVETVKIGIADFAQSRVLAETKPASIVGQVATSDVEAPASEPVGGKTAPAALLGQPSTTPVSILVTTEAAVAPQYGMPPEAGTRPAQLTAEGAGPFQAQLAQGRRVPAANTPAADPGVQLAASQVANAADGAVAKQAPGDGTEGQSHTGTDEELEQPSTPTPASRQSKAAFAEDLSVSEIAAPGATVRVAPAVSEPENASIWRAAPEARASSPLRDAREIAQTLLAESLKRLPRSIELRMDPPHMGSVTALLSQRGQDVTVKFVAQTGEAQQMLSGSSDDLARALSEKGLVLTGFSVDAGYSERSGQERRGGADKPAAGRYRRAARLGAVSAGPQARQAAGSFNWLA